MTTLRCVCGTVVESDGDLLAALELHLAEAHGNRFAGLPTAAPEPALPAQGSIARVEPAANDVDERRQK